MVDCIYNLRWHTKCVTVQKKKFNSGQVYRKDASDNDFLVTSFFVRLLVCIWDVVDFDVCDLMYARFPAKDMLYHMQTPSLSLEVAIFT